MTSRVVIDYWVEQRLSTGWVRVTGSQSTSRKYCEGWLDAVRGIYPCQPHRIVWSSDGLSPGDGKWDLLEYFNGNGRAGPA
uniref:Uncharacterized protein n=1 Tax=viral metagenome TaxID=1070528 RepID=A0A6M3L1C8_9ZZZZ